MSIKDGESKGGDIGTEWPGQSYQVLGGMSP